VGSPLWVAVESPPFADEPPVARGAADSPEAAVALLLGVRVVLDGDEVFVDVDDQAYRLRRLRDVPGWAVYAVDDEEDAGMIVGAVWAVARPAGP